MMGNTFEIHVSIYKCDVGGIPQYQDKVEWVGEEWADAMANLRKVKDKYPDYCVRLEWR